MSFNIPKTNLFKRTSFLGFPLWGLIAVLVAFFIVFVVVFLSLYFIYCRRKKSYKKSYCLPNLVASRHHHDYSSYNSASYLDRSLLSRSLFEIEMNNGKDPEHQSVLSAAGLEPVTRWSPRVTDFWRGNKFCAREIEVATNGLAKENVIGNGTNGIVFRGILFDNTRVAVKNIVSNRTACDSPIPHTCCKAEDLQAEVEAFGQVRHKNLVKLLGYCTEGAYRMLVYEYIDNGNLHQWLHGCPEQVSPLTWSIRIKIIQGIAKGLAYLHEDVEPNVLHRCLKSCNVLLDRQWNPKITDFGLAKLFGPEWTSIIMETSGYVAPGYDSSDAFTEKTDVYSFGILVLEIISGWIPVDRRQTQPYLIEWIKSNVANQKFAHLLDPKLPEMPSLKELKRILLVALRCVDPDINHRPKMGDVVHMLEPCNMLLNNDPRIRRETSRRNYPQEILAVAQSSDGPKYQTNKGESSSE